MSKRNCYVKRGISLLMVVTLVLASLVNAKQVKIQATEVNILEEETGELEDGVSEVTDKVSILENFDELADTNSLKGIQMGNPTLEITVDGFNGSKALKVTKRTENYFGYSYDLAKFAGNTISLKAMVSTYEASTEDSNAFSATLKTTKSGQDDYKQVATVDVVGPDFTTLSGVYDIPAGCESYTLYFETTKDFSYIIDDIAIVVEGDYVNPDDGNSDGYVDTSNYEILKELYQDKFKMGVACEALSHWGGSNPLSEIGNPNKEELIKRQFESITFGNELKPDYNMGYGNEEATDTNLPFVIDTSAKEMLDWAKENNMLVRGHVLVWHSQCPDEIFCKDYTPVYTDDKNSVIDENYLVSRDVMLQRLESYIYNVMKYMYENGYAETVFAWDVVNEAIEVGTNEYNMRDSYWYKTIGPDFMYYAFKYTKDAVVKYSNEYATLYGIDSNNAEALEKIQPELFYNDYNEYQPEKRDAIIGALQREFNGHSIIGDGLIDGIGMQAHLSDNTDINLFCEALRKFDEVVDEVHITELDVIRTSTSVNADYYQAVFYKNLFNALINEVDKGANLTSVTIWGLTDDNSWKKESFPLLFNANLSKKLAFDAIVYAKTGQELPEPAYVEPDFTDMYVTFDDVDTTVETEGFTPRGSSSLTIQKDVVFNGEAALLVSDRTQSWNGASFDVSRFACQTISVSAWVKSAADTVKVSADINGTWPNIASVDTSNGEWTQIKGTYKVPSNLNALQLYFETGDTNDIYIDNVRVKLVGTEEGFEEEESIASARGVGHMPVVSVVDTVYRGTKGHSFLVTRDAQDATMKFDVNRYIGKMVNVKAYVKTEDSKIRLGLDGDNPIQIAEVDTVPGEWTEISGTYQIGVNETSANMYIETNGTADYYVDDIFFEIGEFVNDVESEDLQFTTRWGGAGTITRVEDGANNHAAVLTNRTENYYGTVFDVSAYIGMEVEISLDVKTEDKIIKLTADIDGWPNYAKSTAKSGEYTTIRTVVKLPKGITGLKLYVETDGKSDIYVDNLRIKRVPIGTEHKVTFNVNGRGDAPISQVIAEKNLVSMPLEPTAEGYTFGGWYKEATCVNAWDLMNDRVGGATVLYAKWISTNTGGNSNNGGSSNNTQTSENPSTTTPDTTAPKVIVTMDSYRTIYKTSGTNNAYATVSELKSLLAKKQEVIYEFVDANEKVQYAWNFKVKNYNENMKDTKIDLGIVINSSATYGYNDGVLLNFKQVGKLPMEASVKVDVGSTYKAGDKAYLYIYNAETKKLQCVPNSKYIVDEAGYVSLNIITGAEYVLLPKAAAKSEKTSVLTQVSVTKKITVSKGKKKDIIIKLPDTLMKVNSLEQFDKEINKAVYGAVITYKSSNKSVATVDKAGKVNGKKKGNTIITVTIKSSNNTSKIYKITIQVK